MVNHSYHTPDHSINIKGEAEADNESVAASNADVVAPHYPRDREAAAHSLRPAS